MASVNKAIIIGHLGRDPEVRYMPSGDAVANINVATTETWKDKEGEKQEQTEWHRISMFGKTAEIAGEYLKKGAQVYIEGRLQTRKWTDKDGVERYTTEIRCDRMVMLGKASAGGAEDADRQQAAQDYQRGSGASAARAAAAPKAKAGAKNGSNFDDLEDDIPF